MATDPKAAEPK
jgi:hypothetical protein